MNSTRTLGDLLPKSPVQYSELPGFYEEIPKNIEPAVRLLCEENYTSAVEILTKELPGAKDVKEKARITMWMGLAYGTQAIDHPAMGVSYGTSASETLREAIRMDPKIYEASDVARVLSEGNVHGWGGEDPEKAIQKAQQRGESLRSAIDFYSAGVMLRRQSMQSWGFVDTSATDQKAFRNFAKAVMCNPERYESWASYLPSMMPVGLHDAMSTESFKMYDHFKALRTPLLSDMGPAGLHFRTRQYVSMEDDEKFLNDLMAKRPHEPFAYFQLALWTIENTPTLAIKRFEDFLKKVDSGQIQLKPREQGYRVSAMYKLAFLLSNEKTPQEAIGMYEKVKQISPNYAEVHLNLASLYSQLADKETTSPKKAYYLEQAINSARKQEKYNYLGRASIKSLDLRKQKLKELRLVKKALETSGTQAAESQTTGASSATTGTEAKP